ncbi:MAG: aminotransferase class V-fold PLP-dependent enzyme [Eubacterium sp.]
MIYLDNSATSYPKPKSVLYATNRALQYLSFNSGRGGYKESIQSAEKIYTVREKVADMFGFSPQRIIFTKNCTEALNMAICGSVKRGDHVIISSLEHNSVARVVESLQSKGIITYDIAKYSNNEDETVKNFESKIKPNTGLVVCMHSSNVFGVTFPIAKIGKLCKRNNIRFVVDGAQGAGIADINAKRDNIDILCAPGHKSLLGAMGTGFLAIGDNIDISPIIVGGTGSSSMSLKQPDYYPERLESGTLNNSGIISIGKGIDYINSIGRSNILSHEMSLCSHIYNQLSNMDNVKLYTPNSTEIATMPILSFNMSNQSSEAVANMLANHRICVRAGLHCSPLAHQHFGTSDSGTVRVSPGFSTTMAECNKFVNVVKNLAN